MKINKKNNELELSWYALFWDSNSQKVLYFNIFTHYIIDNLLKEIKKKTVYDRLTLKKHLTADFKYYFWSKAEFEFMISELGTCDHAEKIDIWRQIEPNLDKIVDYVYLKLINKIINNK